MSQDVTPEPNPVRGILIARILPNLAESGTVFCNLQSWRPSQDMTRPQPARTRRTRTYIYVNMRSPRKEEHQLLYFLLLEHQASTQ